MHVNTRCKALRGSDDVLFHIRLKTGPIQTGVTVTDPRLSLTITIRSSSALLPTWHKAQAHASLPIPSMLKSLLPSWLSPGDIVADPSTTAGSEHEVAPDGKHDTQDEDIAEGDTTPKATSRTPPGQVPILDLSRHDDQEDSSEGHEQEEDEPSAPSFPAVNSVQRASSMMPPPPPRPGANAGSTLMPPPSRPATTLRPSAAAGLRVPSTGPLPNRGPPVASQQRVSSSLAPNGTAKATPNPRNKVLLKPGHSPMDWAALTKTGNMSGVSTFQRVTPGQLKTMTGRKGKPAWSSWQGKVYNITPYLPFHPGGEAELMKAAGRDGTKLFMDVHPWVNWENMLETCMVGVLVPENYDQGEGSTLEDMD